MQSAYQPDSTTRLAISARLCDCDGESSLPSGPVLSGGERTRFAFRSLDVSLVDFSVIVWLTEPGSGLETDGFTSLIIADVCVPQV